MTHDDFVRIGTAALASIDVLVAEWLPNGQRRGHEWCVGSLEGQPGRSLKICLSGSGSGIWKDFSTDDGGADLISLHAAIYRVSQHEAAARIAARLGIDLLEVSPVNATKVPCNPQLNTLPKTSLSTNHQSGWIPVIPVPKAAPDPPKAHPRRGIPEAQWHYRDNANRLCGAVYRFKSSDGGKVILPCVFARHSLTNVEKWHWIGFPEPRPLYQLVPLRSECVALIIEGEKCANAAHALLGKKLDVLSWQGGANAVTKTDWSVLKGRNVILWPDADTSGIKAMRTLSKLLQDFNCIVKMVDPPKDVVPGWDVADAIAEGRNIRAMLSAAQPLTAKQIMVVTEDAQSWMRELIRKKPSGYIEDCRENVLLMLNGDPLLQDIVGLNEFSMIQEKRRAPPWGGELGEWDEGDDFELGAYIATQYGVVIKSETAIEKAVAHAARMRRYNPVVEYLRNLEWDGEKRLITWLHRVMGAEDSAYHSLVGTLFILSMVARAFQPGCQMDTAPVFEGGQGRGKSSSMRIIGGPWYSETPFRIGDKDGYMAIQGVWLYEIAELDAFNRAETTGIKAFMSNLNDRFRAPYGRRIVSMPRRTCFCGTTNQDEYFKDTTGNRRFLPVHCGEIDLGLLQVIRDQLFAEAVTMFDAGTRWFPSRSEMDELIEPEQERRELEDVWLPRIFRYVEGIAEKGANLPRERLDRVTAEELLTKALHIEIGKISAHKGETMRIGAIMKKLCWVKKRYSTGDRGWYYQRGCAHESV